MPKPTTKQVGLARALSKLGYCSRSRAFELIRAGEVRVNGHVIRDPERRTNLACDRLTVCNETIAAATLVYYVVNKPRGILTTASDEKGRDTIYSLLPSDAPWVGPVGRLDKASEGLLLLTNDSEWAATITDPASHLDKTYHVQVGQIPSEEMLMRLRSGVNIGDEYLAAKSISILRAGEKNAWLAIVLDEGKNRQIRRMLEASGAEVLRLIRVSIGTLVLADLAKGECRKLSAKEKSELDAALRPARRNR